MALRVGLDKDDAFDRGDDDDSDEEIYQNPGRDLTLPETWNANAAAAWRFRSTPDQETLQVTGCQQTRRPTTPEYGVQWAIDNDPVKGVFHARKVALQVPPFGRLLIEVTKVTGTGAKGNMNIQSQLTDIGFFLQFVQLSA